MGVNRDRAGLCRLPGAQRCPRCLCLAHPGVLPASDRSSVKSYGCVPAGRVVEPDPPTTHTICSHRSSTPETLGTNRNTRTEETPAAGTIWTRDTGASRGEEGFPCWGLVLPGLSVSGEERIEVGEQNTPDSSCTSAT